MVMKTIKKMLGMEADDGITCEQALEQLYEFMDGELDEADAARVEEHFEVCARCYPHLTMERNFRARVQTAIARPEVPAELRGRIQLLLDQEEAGGS